MLVLFHKFVLGFLSYNIWRRGWDYLCYTAISCYFLHRMILLHFVSFVCAAAHVLAGTFENSVMASPVVGSFGEFDPSSETFTAYLERLDQFFVANDIGKCGDDANPAVVRAANQKKVAVMISVIGKKTYSTLRDLCSPENPKEKTTTLQAQTIGSCRILQILSILSNRK